MWQLEVLRLHFLLDRDPELPNGRNSDSEITNNLKIRLQIRFKGRNHNTTSGNISCSNFTHANRKFAVPRGPRNKPAKLSCYRHIARSRVAQKRSCFSRNLGPDSPNRALVNEAWTLMSMSAAAAGPPSFPLPPPPSIIRTVRGRKGNRPTDSGERGKGAAGHWGAEG